MLTVHHLFKSFQGVAVLQDVTFTVQAGERVGLVGANGCGKSTLMRIVAGVESADKGVVHYAPSSLRIGYLEQGFEPEAQLTVSQIIAQKVGDVAQLEEELVRLADALGQQPEEARLQLAYDQVLERLSRLDGQRVLPILAALGLDGLAEGMGAGALSGGQKTRLALALLLLNDPQLLLLDEPTNHLDIQMLEWLEAWLTTFTGGMLIISHDRTFLDQTVNRILYLSSDKHTLKAYEGNYSDYLEQALKEQEKQRSAWRDQQEEIRRVRQDIAHTKEQARQVEQSTTPGQPHVRRLAKKVAIKAKAREKKLERFLESSERVEKPVQGWQLKVAFQTPSHLGQNVLTLTDLAVGYDANWPLLSGLNLQIRAKERVVLTGENGAGKTTLLRTIAQKMPALSGQVRLGQTVRLGYMTQAQEELNPHWNALQTVQSVATFNETDARSYLHFYLFTGDKPLSPIQTLSYGERARLMLAVLVAQGCNFLLLDEPINHLDIPSRTLFEQALTHFEGTVLAVVHDRYFISRFASSVWWVAKGTIRVK